MSEVYVHIANGNFLLLSLTGVKLPTEYFPNLTTDAKGKPDTQALFKRMGELEKTIAKKDGVTRMLKSSLDEVRNRFSQLTSAELDRPADFFGEKTTVRRIWVEKPLATLARSPPAAPPRAADFRSLGCEAKRGEDPASYTEVGCPHVRPFLSPLQA